jgi:hypothetical protein
MRIGGSIDLLQADLRHARHPPHNRRSKTGRRVASPFIGALAERVRELTARCVGLSDPWTQLSTVSRPPTEERLCPWTDSGVAIVVRLHGASFSSRAESLKGRPPLRTPARYRVLKRIGASAVQSVGSAPSRSASRVGATAPSGTGRAAPRLRPLRGLVRSSTSDGLVNTSLPKDTQTERSLGARRTGAAMAGTGGVILTRTR